MSLFGGGNKEAEKSRKLQQIANDRQLAAAQKEEARTAVNRRVPRGRRLFETVTNTNMPTTLGG